MAEEQVQEQTQEAVQEESVTEVAPVQNNVLTETSVPTTKQPAPRPDYILEKFWNATKGEVNVEDFGKSYVNLEKYVGGKKEQFRDAIIDELTQEANAERPETIDKYELPKLPENINEDIVNANPMSGWWKNFCWDNSLDQEVYQEGINKYVDAYIGQQPDIKIEKDKLGENAEARLSAVNSWASTFFSPEQYEIVSQTMGASADGIEALEKVIESQKQNISRSSEVLQPERPLTIDDVRNMMKDKRYYDGRERDPSYVAKVDDAFNRLYRG